MNATAIVLILLIRVLLPLAALLGIGEYIRRRETNYWLRM